jgi:hypothetical protein
MSKPYVPHRWPDAEGASICTECCETPGLVIVGEAPWGWIQCHRSCKKTEPRKGATFDELLADWEAVR